MFKDAESFSSYSVDSIDNVKAFYTETLGLEGGEDYGGLQVVADGKHAVMIYPKGLAHVPATFTVLNFRVANVETAVDALIAAGVTMEQYDNEYMKTNEKGISTSDRGNMAWFKDPAGNILSVLDMS